MNTLNLITLSWVLAGFALLVYTYLVVGRKIVAQRRAKEAVQDFGELKALRTILTVLAKRSPTGEIHIKNEEFDKVRAGDKIKSYMGEDGKRVIVRYVKGK